MRGMSYELKGWLKANIWVNADIQKPSAKEIHHAVWSINPAAGTFLPAVVSEIYSKSTLNINTSAASGTYSISLRLYGIDNSELRGSPVTGNIDIK